jgi:predicted transcriptional regulator
VIAIERAGLALAALARLRKPTITPITLQIKRVGSSLRESVSWSEELRKVSVLNLDVFFVQSA